MFFNTQAIFKCPLSAPQIFFTAGLSQLGKKNLFVTNMEKILQLQNLDTDVHYAIPLILHAFENFHNDIILLYIISFAKMSIYMNKVGSF